MPTAFYFLTAEIPYVGIDGLQKICPVVCFTVFKTVFPFSMAILIFKCIISAETSVLIRIGFLAEGSEKAVWTSTGAVIRCCSVLLATLQHVFLYLSEAWFSCISPQ